MKVPLGSRKIGDGEPCFITFEAGPTHDGLETAKRLVSHAAKAGADAVKFQVVDAERLCADKELLFPYEVLADRETGETRTVFEPQYEILRRRMLERDEWRELKRHSDSLGLAFFATALFDDEVELLEEISCDSIKIASGDVNNFPLLRRAARMGMCVQLDTGSSSLDEIAKAVEVVREEGNERIIIHQCPSGYPARLESINLNIIKTLKEMFPYPVAYSDHTPGWEMDVAAVAMGANLVEKTITEDHTTPSIEHIMSLEPHEMEGFIRIIRDVETAFGTSERILHETELEKRVVNRRSAFLERPVKAGDRLGSAEVVFRRPGDGICGDVYESLLDRTFRIDLPGSHKLSLEDLA